MLDAVRLLLSIGVSYIDIAQLASTNPARLLGLSECGSLSRGNRADLVALDDHRNVRLTLTAGHVSFHAT